MSTLKPLAYKDFILSQNAEDGTMSLLCARCRGEIPQDSGNLSTLISAAGAHIREHMEAGT